MLGAHISSDRAPKLRFGARSDEICGASPSWSLPQRTNLLFNPDLRNAAPAALAYFHRNSYPRLAGVLPMENVMRSRPKRSLIRRLAAPVASLALLSGGSWGAYQYYGSELLGAVEPPDTMVAAHSAPAAKDELKMLFASEDKPATTIQPTKRIALPKKETPAQADRYTLASAEPATIELATPKLPPLVDPPQKSVVAQPGLGDRYAKSLTMPVVPKMLNESKPEQRLEENGTLPTEAKTDVARGQEPNNNPLRAASSPTTSPNLDAKAAFGESLAQAPKVSSQPLTSSQPAANRSDNLSTALQKALPLPSTPRPTALTNDRYQVAQSPLAMSTKQPVNAQDQRPAPPLAIQSPPLENMPPRGSSPFGAPPERLQTGRGAATEPLVADFGRGASQGLTPTPGLANHPGTGRPGERLLEGVQSPSITIQKLAPAQIQVGKRCTFAIRVQNSGQRTAQNVRIRDEVPLGTELVGTAPRATVSGGQIMWDLGTLSPGEQRTVEMELLPKEEGELGSVAVVSLSAQASAKSRCTRPELALRLTSNPQVHVGEQQLVQIEVSNPGSGDATGVMLLETIPAGVSHEAGPALEFEIGTLRAGENRRLELMLTAERAGKINNVMTARADASLQVEAGCEFEVIAPDLQVSVEGPQRRFLERPATYRVSIDNPGTASAKDVQLVTHLPKGMQFVSANNMGEYDSSSHSVHWSLAELPANERGTVELIALPIEAGEQTLQFATKADQGLEDHTDKQVVVEGLSALMFEVIDVEGLIELGKETTYEIRVQNQGSKAATNVQVVAIMPAGMRPVTGQGETRHTVQGERVIFAPLSQLAPKSETTFRIQAQGIRPGDHRVRFQITDDDVLQPIIEEVITRVYADE